IPAGPLLLEVDGGRVAWLRDEERLLRLSWDPDGTLSGARAALPRGVLSFRWQRLGGRVVAVEIARRAPSPLRADRLGTPLWAHREDGVEILSCSVALRRDE
ncbi:MAG TPA: hypothetical protein VLA75_02925, partial [Thermoanaerobaculia bacterium]|nr:hypothetical protein [Thermoanaerobaculia bacterium]